MNKITFDAEVTTICIHLKKVLTHKNVKFVPDDSSIKSILDYRITFDALEPSDTHYMAIG